MTIRPLISPALGTWISSGDPVVTELAADCGFDWLLLDLEHGNGTESNVVSQLQSCRGSTILPVVRVGAPHPELISRILDWGAAGIMVPHVNNAAEASGCVAAMRYPPRGKRGVSRSVRAFGYGLKPFPGADPATEPLLIAQIETIEAVSNAEEIAAVDGVDVLFVGPADLQFDLAARPEIATQDFATCLKTVAEATIKAGKQCGILLKDPADYESFLQRGFHWLAIDSDLGILRAGYHRLLKHWAAQVKTFSR